MLWNNVYYLSTYPNFLWWINCAVYGLQCQALGILLIPSRDQIVASISSSTPSFSPYGPSKILQHIVSSICKEKGCNLLFLLEKNLACIEDEVLETNPIIWFGECENHTRYEDLTHWEACALNTNVCLQIQNLWKFCKKIR